MTIQASSAPAPAPAQLVEWGPSVRGVAARIDTYLIVSAFSFYVFSEKTRYTVSIC